MNKKLLTDKALREDIYCQMMVTAGWLAVRGAHGDDVRDMIELQIDHLMPIVKKHIKRHKNQAKQDFMTKF